MFKKSMGILALTAAFLLGAFLSPAMAVTSQDVNQCKEEARNFVRESNMNRMLNDPLNERLSSGKDNQLMQQYFDSCIQGVQQNENYDRNLQNWTPRQLQQ